MADHARALAASRRFLTDADVTAIQTAVKRTGKPDPLVVDLGSGAGTSALAVFDIAPAAQVLTFDINENAIHWAEKAVRHYYPKAMYETFIGDAAEGAELIDYVEIDVLLHDASHERDQVEADLRAWLEVLTFDAPIWVHDYAPPPPSWGGEDESEGVRAAIAELQGEGLLTPGSPMGLGWLGAKA